MTDDDLLAQASMLRPVYVDGFGAYRVVNGVLRCVGYLLQGGAELNLICSLSGAEQAQKDTYRVLREDPVKGLAIWRGHTLAH